MCDSSAQLGVLVQIVITEFSVVNALPILRPLHISVDAACLHYYRFTDMNTYIREE